MSDTSAIPRDEFFDSLLGDFLDESGQLLDRLNENMLQLDEWVRSLDDSSPHHCDLNLLNEMFRAAHSLKGLSAMLGLNDINHLTHKIENVFDAARKNELDISGDVVELMFQAIDRLVGLVDILKEPDNENVDCDDVLDGIHQLLESAGVEKKIVSQADAERALQQLTGESAASSVAEGSKIEASAVPAEETSGETVSNEMVTGENLSAENVSNGTADATETASSLTVEVKEEKNDSETREAVVEMVDPFAGLVDEVELQPKYVSIFIDETELSLDNLTEVLLTLEGDGHQKAVEQLLITSHRIKGSAASIGLNRVAKLAHLMEDLMQDLFTSHRPLTPRIVDALLACIDGLKIYVDSLKTGNPRTEHFSRLAHELLVAQKASESTTVSPSETSEVNQDATEANPTEMNAGENVSEKESENLSPNATNSAAVPVDEGTKAVPVIDESLRSQVRNHTPEDERESALVGKVAFQQGILLAGLKGRLLYEKLANTGIVRYFNPPVEGLEEMEELAELEFGVISDKSVDLVERMLRVAGVEAITVEPLGTETEKSEKIAVSATPTPSKPEPTKASVSNPSQKSEIAPERGGVEKKTIEAPAASTRTGSPTVSSPTASSPTTAASKTEKARPTDTGSNAKPTETLRVDIERLDQLMNLAGQLVINKARFTQIGDKMKKVVGGRQSRHALNNISAILEKMTEGCDGDLNTDLENMRSQARRIQHDFEEVRRDVEALASIRTSVNDLFETIHLLDRVADGIQQSVMDTRMLPIGPLFQRFKRVIRDITRSNGKNIHLEINGEKTELDKRMIDELGDPLIHMVRNSADHGIESPEVRRAAGKPEQGTVSLDAFHRGNSIYIRVADDGKGLDSERIKAKAIERGLITPADAERMTKSQIFQLIWEPGLSTAEKVTEVSGRGMGMDIVKSKIEDLNGTVELDSEPGRGTTITIKLPLTLAILPSLMVSLDGDVFAMPLESVVEIVSVAKNDVCTVHNRATARVRGRVVSMVRLEEVFAWHVGARNGSGSASSSEEAPSTLVIIGENGREIGLVVDHVIGEQDIVIKSMAENYRNVPGVAGASILGDGRVSLILDLAAVIDMATCRKAEAGV